MLLVSAVQEAARLSDVARNIPDLRGGLWRGQVSRLAKVPGLRFLWVGRLPGQSRSRSPASTVKAPFPAALAGSGGDALTLSFLKFSLTPPNDCLT